MIFTQGTVVTTPFGLGVISFVDKVAEVVKAVIQKRGTRRVATKEFKFSDVKPMDFKKQETLAETVLRLYKVDDV